MRHNRLKVGALLMLGFGLTGIQAQESVTVSGGNASGSGGSISYSVGQMVYTTNTGTTGSVAQGVQQPYEISVISMISEAGTMDVTVSSYPNPVNDYLLLKVDDVNEDLSYRLFDLVGKLLESKRITDNNISIDMREYLPSTFILNVMLGDKEIKSFKITKNQCP